MNVHCPHCQTVYRVNPARVPTGGVHARCARCSDTFRVEHPDSAVLQERRTWPVDRPLVASHADTALREPDRRGETASQEAPTTAAGSTAAPVSATPPAAPALSAPAAPAAPPPPATPRVGEPTHGTPSRASGKPAAGAPRPVFGSRDPDARAKRIARALVSDIVAYHPDRLEQARSAGNLRAVFRDEIMKSWEEYVAQVGIETAKRTSHFRDALNDILARGQKLF